jgi:hypothetical protein
MALSRRSHTAYAPLFGQISQADAHDEPAHDQLFVEPGGAYPKTSIHTTVTIDGLVLDVTLNDMSLSEAVALLKRRGAQSPNAAPPAPSRPAQRRPAPSHKPKYQALWLELD